MRKTKTIRNKMMEQVGVSVIVCSQTKGIKPKFRGRKLRSVVYWQGALKQEDMKQVGRKTRATCPKGR